MNDLVVVEYSGERILTTQQLAENYETETDTITKNFNRNKDRYVKNKHYYCLEGDELREFRANGQIDLLPQNINKLYLWTERGALLHAKSLNTDVAWEVYDKLVEEYFKKQSEKSAIDVDSLSPDLQMFKRIFDGVAQSQIEQKRLAERLEKTERVITTVSETILQRDDDWRESMKRLFNSAVMASNMDYKELRQMTYEMLEERARCDLGKRLRNLQERLFQSGATKTKINATSRLDVIENDARLKEIYTTIVKEVSIRYAS